MYFLFIIGIINSDTVSMQNKYKSLNLKLIFFKSTYLEKERTIYVKRYYLKND